MRRNYFWMERIRLMSSKFIDLFCSRERLNGSLVGWASFYGDLPAFVQTFLKILANQYSSEANGF